MSIVIILCISLMLGVQYGVRGVRAEVVGETVESIYHLRPGWNLISFPAKPITITTAGELMDYVDRRGGYVTLVSRWDGDRWQEYAAVGKERYGQNFSLISGEAYFISNTMDITMSVVGQSVGDEGVVTLRPGWNAIALNSTQFSNAKAVIDSAHLDKQETVTEIDRWLSGNWQGFIKRWYSSANIQEYGENFQIESQVGYMIKSNVEMRLSP